MLSNIKLTGLSQTSQSARSTNKSGRSGFCFLYFASHGENTRIIDVHWITMIVYVFWHYNAAKVDLRIHTSTKSTFYLTNTTYTTYIYVFICMCVSSNSVQWGRSAAVCVLCVLDVCKLLV